MSIRSWNVLRSLLGPQIASEDFQSLGRYAVNFIVDCNAPIGDDWAIHQGEDPNSDLIKIQRISHPRALVNWLDGKKLPGEEATLRLNETRDLKLISVKLDLLLDHQNFMRKYTDKFHSGETKMCIINANIHRKLSLVDNDPILKENMYVLGTLGLKTVVKTEMGLIFL